MNRILLDKDFQTHIKDTPYSWGVIYFYEGNTLLYCSKTSNVHNRLIQLEKMSVNNTELKELFDKSEFLEFEIYQDPMDALIKEKITIQNYSPIYNQLFNFSSEYCYLSLNAAVFPYISIEDYTITDSVYVGPFRSRFFLIDVIDTISRVLKLPFCELSTYPCGKLEDNVCSGYCLNFINEEEDGKGESNANSIKDIIEKMNSLLNEAFCSTQNKILTLIERERSKYFNDLEFIKADLLDNQITSLRKYRDWIIFIQQARSVNYESKDIVIEQCQIKEVKFENVLYNFYINKDSYRPNEILALDKTVVDEMDIVYKYLKKNKV